MKPPEFLGPYRVGETLGRGGMGTVFQAKHERSGEEVAVKLIATQVSDEMKFRRRFHGEVETLKRLRHPNIVRLIGYGEEHGMLFYSMELCQGRTLQTIIREEKKLTWMRSLDIAIQVCSALKHAHDIGVIHRDLKPANLIIEGDDQVKLVDFGISKIFGYSQTAVGAIMGTADYMAPEQASGTGITSRTDLYSLGCVLYCMLVGRPPFKGKSITEVIAAVKTSDAVPLDLIDPDLPEDVVQIVSELLEKTPENRPPTALAVMNRLKAMRAGLQRMQTMSDADQPTDVGVAGRPTAESVVSQPPTNRSSDTYRDDTIAMGDSLGLDKTDLSIASPSAKTVGTAGHDGKGPTVAGTMATSPAPHPQDDAASFDTSNGAAGQTHFQTVTDVEGRKGFISSSEEKSENSLGKLLSIVAIAIALIVCAIVVANSFRKPSAERLLAAIEEQRAQQGDSFALQNEMERFLKLYPDHARAQEMRDRQTTHRIASAINRLRLKKKLRTSDGPLHEEAFLEAMDLRTEDPALAAKKLRDWVTVFASASAGADGEELVQLAELARFEAERLEASGSESAATMDPKLAELYGRIEEAKQLPKTERDEMLRGILSLYEEQPWAAEALSAARSVLEEEETPKSDESAAPDDESSS